jgi:hypothetical protein
MPYLFLAAYACGLIFLTRGLTIDYWDGILNLLNSLAVTGQIRDFDISTHRGAAWLLLSAPVSLARAKAGPLAALQLAHAVMIVFAATALAAAYSWHRKLMSARAAAAVLVLAAANPLTLRYAPFVLFDVLAMIPVLAYTVLCQRWIARPTPAGFALLAAAYAAAVLCRYHLVVLVFLEPAYRLLKRDWRAALFSPCWLLPLATYPLLVGVMSLLFLVGRSYGSGPQAVNVLSTLFELISRSAASLIFLTDLFPVLGQVNENLLLSNIKVNFLDKPAVSPLAYAFRLCSLLGPIGALFAAVGLHAWARKDAKSGKFLLAALLAPVLALSFVPNKEDRYIIPFLPLVYAALGRGLDEALGSKPGKLRKSVILGAALLLAPWHNTAAALRLLGRDPSLRTRFHLEASRNLEESTPRTDCIKVANFYFSWESSELRTIGGDQLPMYGYPTTTFFTRRPVVSHTSFRSCGTVLDPESLLPGAPPEVTSALRLPTPASSGPGPVGGPAVPAPRTRPQDGL